MPKTSTFLRGFFSKALYFCFILLCPFLAFAQNVPPCGTDQIQLKRIAADSAYRAFVEQVKPQTNKAVVDTTSIITIPVVFVVYHLGEPVGVGSNVSEADLQNQVNLMNSMFAGALPTYGGVDTRIRFTLARRTASCAPFNGIARVDARSVPGYESSGLDLYDWQKASKLRALVPEYRNSAAERFVVVRVMHQITSAGGWAGFGGDIVVGASTMRYGSEYNTVLAHEMGHVLYLHHTFNGATYNNNTGKYNCPPNADPLSDGDQVADTDPHKLNEPFNSCSSASEGEINDCTGRPFGLIGRNFMSYGCNLMLFTDGQRYRMRSYLADGLRGLATSVYTTAPDVNGQLTSMACNLSVVSAINYTSDGITEVQFQGIRKSSTAQVYDYGHYQDYSCQERTTVTAGQSYSLSVKGYGTHQRAYIDYNNDGVFQENTELVWTNSSPTGLITIPNTAVMDRYLRMRIVVDNGSVPPTACHLPGSSNGSGEVEDYAVRILPADTPHSLSIGTLASPYLCRGQQLAVPLVTLGTFPADNIFFVQLSDATGSFANPIMVGSGTRSPISVTLPANATLGEDYRLRVLATNPVLTSESSPVLGIENPASGTLVATSYTVASGQATTLVAAFTGRAPFRFIISRNGLDWLNYSGFTQSSIRQSVQPLGTEVYTLRDIQGSCGVSSTGNSVTLVSPCAVPTSLTETHLTTYGFRANWTIPSGSTVLLQWKVQGAATWSEQRLQNYASWYINGTLNTTYVWRVKTSCLYGDSNWSVERTVTLSCPIPSELNQVTGHTSALLRWLYLGDRMTYTLQWRPAGVSSWNNISLGNFNQYNLTGLITNSNYEWRIQAQCIDGAVTEYSAISSFTTQCSAPIWTNYNSSFSSLSVFWNGAPDSRHQVRYRKNDSSQPWILSDSTTALTYATIRNLDVNQTYEVQVRAVCSATVSSAFTISYVLQLTCRQPSLPELTRIGLTSADIRWFGDTGQRYDLRWRAASTASWTEVQSLTTTTYQFVGLTTGTAYEVQLRSVCSGTVVSAYTSSFTFTPSCPVPTSSYMFTTRAGATQTEVVFNIDAGVQYAVQWRPFGTATWQSSSTFVAPYTTTGYIFQLTSLATNTTYEWRVQSYCSGGQINTSTVRQFTTGCFIPYNSGVSVSPTNATVYIGGTTGIFQIRWRAVGTTTWTESSTFTAANYTITGLTNDITYEWQVRAVCSPTENSAYSTSYQFTTRCVAPSSFNMNVFSVTARAAQLSWWNNGTPVDLRWRPVGAADWTTISSLTTTAYSLTALTTGTTYEWQIRSVCTPSLSSSYTSGATFTPVCPVATSLTEPFISPKSAQVQWSAVSGQPYAVQWRVMGESSWMTSVSIVSSYNGTYISNPFGTLTAGTTYEWRVQTLCDGSTTTSASRTFVTQCTVATPINFYSVGSRSAIVYWNGPSGVAGISYRVRWRVVGTTAWTEAGSTSNTSLQLTGLSGNTSYEWQVQTNCDGSSVAYSASGPVFRTACPVAISYGTSVGEVGATLWWSNFPGDIYDLRYRQSGSASWTTVASLTTGTYSLTGLTPSTAYEWQVVVNCGGATTVSSLWSFTTTATCDLNEPNNTYQIATVIPANATSFSTGAVCLSVPADNDWYRWEINGQVYYILVHPYAYNTSGPYALTLGVTNGVAKMNTLAVNNVRTDTYLKLYASDGITLLAANDDSNNTVLSEITYTLAASCSVMHTLKAGLWTDPTVWSCGRVPVSTDAVEVRHEVTMPESSIGRAMRITYWMTTGKLLMGTGARLLLGQ